MQQLIFISHASPDENPFVLWLAGRLTAEGYEVWSDVTKLIGGECFWERIEIAIREHTAVFLSVVSKSAVRKRGFLNELSIASAIETARNVDDFVVPIRFDNFPFLDFPAQLHRKSAIDFSSGWHVGLVKLLTKLESSSAPRASNAGMLNCTEF